MTTPNLQLSEVTDADTPAAASLNDSFRSLDSTVQLAVLSVTTTTPPADAVQGDRYIVPPAATGAWIGRTNHVAYRTTTGWSFRVPRPGWRAWSIPDEALIVFNGIEWDEFAGGGGSSPTTTKGDLIVRSATEDDRLPVGADGAVLVADAAEALGVKWAAAIPVGQTASGARVYKNAAQSIPDATLTAVTWPVESFDTDAYHDTGVDPSRFTVDLDGKYLVACALKWDSNTVGTRAVYVVVNGDTATRRAADLRVASAGVVNVTIDQLDLEAGDYVEFFAYQDSGGARDVVTLEQVSTAFISRVGVTAAQTAMRGATWVRSTTILIPVDDVDVACPVKAQIVGVRIMTLGGTGSCVVDIWKDTWANFPPTVLDTITAAAKPTIVLGNKYEDLTLTGWNTTVNAGDVLRFHLESSTIFKRIAIQVFMKEIQ